MVFRVIFAPMKFRPAILLFLLSSFLILTESCITRKDISYFQDVSDTLSIQNITKSFEARIAAGDILSIHVSSLSTEASSFFNVVGEESDKQVANTYLVDAQGNIEMPLIGVVSVGNLTGIEAKETIKEKLTQYLIDPTVNVRIRNFKVTVLGEVQQPGVYSIPNEKVTLVEALGMAGDLSIFGKRMNVILIREENGTRKFVKIDLRSKNLFESDYYYLHSNDIIYIEPGKGKIASADAWYRIIPIVLSGLSTIALFIRLGI